MKGTKTKVVVSLVVLLLLIFGSSVSATISPHNLELYENQTSVNTGGWYGWRGRCVNVYNYTSSDYGVYCYFYQTDVITFASKKTVNHLVDRGETFNSGWYDYVYGGPNSYNMYFNPQGILTDGCRTSGRMEVDYY